MPRILRILKKLQGRILAVLALTILVSFSIGNISAASEHPEVILNSSASLGVITQETVSITGKVIPGLASVSNVGYQIDSTSGIWQICSMQSSGLIAPPRIDTTMPKSVQEGADNSVLAIASDLLDRVYIGGEFQFFQAEKSNYLARLNDDGTLDKSFDIQNGPNGPVENIVLQNDGKLVITGQFTSYKGVEASKVARINPDGTLDTSFSVGKGPNGDISTITLLDSGDFLLAGDFTQFNEINANRVVKINTKGLVDESFTFSNIFAGQINTTKEQSDGKILIGGEFNNIGGIDYLRLARLNADGSIDNTFSNTGVINGQINDILLNNDDSFFIVGDFEQYSSSSQNYIAKMNKDGIEDTTFDTGTGPNEAITRVMSQSDGRILILGDFTEVNGVAQKGLSRLEIDGTLDETFLIGSGNNGRIKDMMIKNDLIYLVGDFTELNGLNRQRIARLSQDGGVDSTFMTSQGINGAVYTITALENGKVLITGNFHTYEGYNRKGIVLLNDDGTVDSSFDPGLGVEGIIYAVAEQADGKFVIGGSFSSYNGISYGNIARINSDGSLDTSYNIGGTGSNDVIYSIVAQKDGKMLVGGNFGRFNESPAERIIRLNQDGTIDSSFSSNVRPDGVVSKILSSNDGKIYISGAFEKIQGTDKRFIARLNNNGTLDETFITGLGPNGRVYDMKQNSAGQVIIVGEFSQYNGATQQNIARIQDDGSIDPTFVMTGGFDKPILTLELQSDGKILIGGEFTQFNEMPYSSIARLNQDGSLETEFTFIHSSVGPVHAISSLSDNSTVIGGEFISFDNSFSYLGKILPTQDIQNFACDVVVDQGAVGSHTIYLKAEGSAGRVSSIKEITYAVQPPPDTPSPTVIPTQTPIPTTQDAMVAEPAVLSAQSRVKVEDNTELESSDSDSAFTLTAASLSMNSDVVNSPPAYGSATVSFGYFPWGLIVIPLITVGGYYAVVWYQSRSEGQMRDQNTESEIRKKRYKWFFSSA